MLAICPAVPVLVLLELHELIRLVLRQLIRAVSHRRLHAGAVRAGPHAVGLGQALLVVRLVNNPVAGQAENQVEACKSLAENKRDLVIAGLVKANGAIILHFGVIYAVDEIVRQISFRLAPCGITGGNRGEERQVLIRQRDKAVFVRHGNQSFPVRGVKIICAVGFNIVIQRVAAGPIKRKIQADVHTLAVRTDILSVFAKRQIVHRIGVAEGVVRISGVARVGVSLSARNAELTGIVVGRTVVQKVRVQKLLHGVHIGIRINRRAVFPGSIRIQIDGVGIAARRRLGDAEFRMLSLDLFRHIDRLGSRHFRNDHIAGIGVLALNRVQLIVVDDAVKADKNVSGVSRIGVVISLIGVRIPVRRHRDDGVLIRIRTFHRRIRLLGAVRIIRRIATLVVIDDRVGRVVVCIVRRIGAGGKHRNDHDDCQQQSNCLLHSENLLQISYVNDSVKADRT